MDELGKIGKRTFGENIGFYVKSGWTFEKFFEKFILIGLCVLGMWKFFELVVGWIR